MALQQVDYSLQNITGWQPCGCITITAHTCLGAPHMPMLLGTFASMYPLGCPLILRCCGAGVDTIISEAIWHHSRQSSHGCCGYYGLVAVNHEHDSRSFGFVSAASFTYLAWVWYISLYYFGKFVNYGILSTKLKRGVFVRGNPAEYVDIIFVRSMSVWRPSKY